MTVPSLSTQIWLAIKSQIDKVKVDGAVIDKAWPAQPYTPKTSSQGLPTPYLSVGRVSANPQRLMIHSGARRIHSGSIILTLVHPLMTDYLGKSAPEEAYIERASQVASYFPEDARMTWGGVCLRVISQPSIQDGYQDSGYWRIPVVIDWRTIA